jgi:hypothetical protein
MTSLTDVDFVPMRLGKVVAVGTEDGPSFCVVLESVTQERRLPIWIGETEGLYLSGAVSRLDDGRMACDLVGVAGFEPTASSSRTTRTFE